MSYTEFIIAHLCCNVLHVVRYNQHLQPVFLSAFPMTPFHKLFFDTESRNMVSSPVVVVKD